MDNERIEMLEAELEAITSRIDESRRNIKNLQRQAAYIHKELAPVYLARWQEHTGSTLAPGDKLLVTREYLQVSETGWQPGREIYIKHMVFSDDEMIFDIGTKSDGVQTRKHEHVERMRTAYLEQKAQS